MTRARAGAPAMVAEFEPEFVIGLTKIFEEMVVFNQTLGFKVTKIRPDSVSARILMRPELVGHYSYNRLHGGVISASLDNIGALAVMAAIGARHMDDSPAARLQRFAKLGTIDLRVDYLRPGISDYFDMHAQVLRLGSRVASTRMEFCGADGRLMSTGAAAYMVA